MAIPLIDLPAYDEEEPEGFNWKDAIPGTDRKAAAAVEGHLQQIANEIKYNVSGKSPNYVHGLRRSLNIFAERIYVQ